MKDGRQHKDDEEKEDFCPACVAVPMALVGAGVGAAGAQDGTSSQRNKIMMYVGVGVALLSIAIALYYLLSCKECRGG